MTSTPAKIYSQVSRQASKSCAGRAKLDLAEEWPATFHDRRLK